MTAIVSEHTRRAVSSFQSSDQTGPCFLKSSYRRFTGNTGEVVEEFVQGMPVFQVVGQVLKRNTSPAKNRLSAQNGAIAHDYRWCRHNIHSTCACSFSCQKIRH